MLAPPDDLHPGMLTSALVEGWGLRTRSLSYLAVGWGSHHWDVTDGTSARWFVTVDELSARRWSPSEPLDLAHARLERSLLTACELAGLGMSFVHAPVRSQSGAPLRRIGDSRFAVSVYAHVAGQSYHWGEFGSAEHRLAVTEFIAAIHSAPGEARRHPPADDLTIACRDALETMLGPAADSRHGPYSKPAEELLRARAPSLRRRLRHYDLVAARYSGSPTVVTHGEPHPGNTMLTPGGWLLIDWDTTMLSLPERDLCNLDPGDGSVLAAYQRRTGRKPDPELLEFFRLRWDLTDLALAACRFSGPHGTDANDQKTFALFTGLLDQLTGSLGSIRRTLRPIVAPY